MPKAWEKLDLEGGGLQTANLALKRALKRPGVAYGLWLAFFPLAAHAIYLRALPRAAAFWLLDLAVILAYGFGYRSGAVALGAVLIAAMLWDLRWIDRRLVALNKSIRMALYLRPSSGAPSGFRGHYLDDDELARYAQEKERERAGHQPATTTTAPQTKRAPSFAEQEAMLRELKKTQNLPKDK